MIQTTELGRFMADTASAEPVSVPPVLGPWHPAISPVLPPVGQNGWPLPPPFGDIPAVVPTTWIQFVAPPGPPPPPSSGELQDGFYWVKPSAWMRHDMPVVARFSRVDGWWFTRIAEPVMPEDVAVLSGRLPEPWPC